MRDAIRDGAVRRREADAARAAAGRRRSLADSLLNSADFVEWIGDVLARNGYWDYRELSPYQQGVRNGIAREVQRLAEAADCGAEFMRRVFVDNIVNPTRNKEMTR